MAAVNGVKKKVLGGTLTGAAFLMAVSAIGPGFLTQTTQFTVLLGASMAFAILVSILIDIGAQLNTWRIICISEKRGRELADAVIPHSGWPFTAVIAVLSLIFNVGNFNGCALGLEVMFGLPPIAGVILSAVLAVGLFLLPSMLKGMDWFSKVLGAGMILLTIYIVIVTVPPLNEAALRAVAPERVDIFVIVTLVGGTIGGYIMFSGAHRLLDGGVTGPENIGHITWASVQGILIAGIMRIVMFLAVLGVVHTGATLPATRPVFAAFEAGAGAVGLALSCLVYWAAAITSVVGCSYTTIAFLGKGKSDTTNPWLVNGFLIFSLAATLIVQAAAVDPTDVLIWAGTINGVFTPPIVLGLILLAAYRRDLMGTYRHPWWAGAFGVLAWVATVLMAGYMIWRMAGPAGQ